MMSRGFFKDTEERNFRALGFAGPFGWPGKVLSQFEGVAGKFVRLSAEFASGQMSSLVVGNGRGGVGMGRKVVELCDPVVRARWHDLSLRLGNVVWARLKFYATCSSSFKYSSGTSSSGTSRVVTSDTSGSLAFSTPATTPASNAFPSSSNSSTLSDSATASSDIS